MYDPLISAGPQGQDFPDSYWAATAGEAPPCHGELQGNHQVDVVVIGGGYTGLSAAYFSASEHQQDTLLLEANHIGWGASGRNAGFVLKGSGRLSYPQMLKRWGMDTTKMVYQEFNAAVDTLKYMVDAGNIDCMAQEPGYIKVAHRPKYLELLKQQGDFMRATFGEQTELLCNDALAERYMINHESHGALRYSDGFGIHPLKLARGYQRLAMQAGAKLHSQSPVIDWKQENGKHRLITPKGEVIANKVILAGNAYSPKSLHPLIKNRYLPVLTSIIVTRPLTPDEIQQTGIQTNQVVMDTRALKYYYRLLPDNRILFGGRGAIRGKDEFDSIYPERLSQALCKSFPCLQGIGYDYNWNGWIGVALDDMPHVYGEDNVYYSLGYCGAGVSFSVQAGRRLAEKAMGQTHKDNPLLNCALPKFPLAPLRRVGQWGYYHLGRFKDEYL